MGIIELIGISVGLAMDAFAVSVTNGIVAGNKKIQYAFKCALIYGLFQAVMPTIGYFVGQTFSAYVEKYDHIIALLLLTFIGGKMIYEAIKSDDEYRESIKLSIGLLMVQGVATSIDALAVGISFATLAFNIITSAILIGIITFVMSFVGVFVGNKIGVLLNKKATITGGVILIAIGLKIFAEHTFFV